MVEVVGALLLTAVGAGDIVGIAGLGTLAGTTVAGISIASIVGTTAILGVTIGLEYALAAKPSVPPPEQGSQALKQSIPPRIMAYGTNRLAGYYMMFEAIGFPAISFDVMAFHHGKIEKVNQIYFHDDPISPISDLTHGGGPSNITGFDAQGRYSSGCTKVEIKMGDDSQTTSALIAANVVSGITALWTSAFLGNGIAYAVLESKISTDGGFFVQPSGFTQIFPHNLPLMSVAADCTQIWDPRDVAQSRLNKSTWKMDKNPVLQWIDFLTRDGKQGGMGLDYDITIAPNIVALMAQADLCDAIVNGNPRYESNGWFQFDNNPSDILASILSTCDGWMSESGDGSLMLKVGVYQVPTTPPIKSKHILAFTLNYGHADEQTVNQLEVSYTDPTQKYVPVQTDPVQDVDSISETGVIRSQPIDLKWVQNVDQAERLAERALSRLNPDMTGSFTSTLFGLQHIGQRWITLQYPTITGLEDTVVEIQDCEVNMKAGQIVWNFITADTTPG